MPDPIQVPNVGSFFKNPTINKKEINTSKFNLEDLIIWYHDSDTVKVGAARLIQLVKNDLENFNNVSIYSNHALVLISNGKATQREILNFANNIKDVVNETFNISLDSICGFNPSVWVENNSSPFLSSAIQSVFVDPLSTIKIILIYIEKMCLDKSSNLFE